jgi:hypothetical protein
MIVFLMMFSCDLIITQRVYFTMALAALRAAAAQGVAGLKKTPWNSSIALMGKRRSHRACFLPGCLILIAVGIVTSCGPRAIGYGVIMWGETSGAAATGAVVAVIEKSERSNTCLVAAPGESKPREFPTGRIRLFSKRAEAAKFAEAYAPFVDSWAFSQKQDPPPLPIREEPKPEANAVYKLKPGQLLKIVDRSAKKQAVSPYEDYWYSVVTEDGFTGWCFGHYLKLFTSQGDPAKEASRLMSQDEALDRILGSTWRPDWFQDMISSAMIDLARLREDVGFFPDPSQNTFHLVLPLYSLDFTYQRIDRLSSGNYVAVGANLRISLLGDEKISINYRYKDQEIGGIFTIIDEDISGVIEREQKRRQDIYDSFRAGGDILKSSAYGTIRVNDEMLFTWVGFDKLVPSVIGKGTGTTGRIDFPFHVARELQGAYDGVITFSFDGGKNAPATPAAGGDPGTPAASRQSTLPQTAGAAGVSAASSLEVSFLFKSVSGGVRFSSIAKDAFSDLLVTRLGISPVTIFFSQGQ